MRSFGVEEELLLVDAETGELAPVAEELLKDDGTDADGAPWGATGFAGILTHELKLEQVESASAPYEHLAGLAKAIAQGRQEADRRAMSLGARVIALGTYPMHAPSHVVRNPRYTAMEERFGLTLQEQLTCGFHVHVSVDSDDEAVAVLDRIRIWLPVLLALSTNSPFWQGADSGYASFRYQAWRRWPTAGPTDVLGSGEAYNELVEMLLGCNVLLDGGMVYFDARLSVKQPTVEIRIADVCLDATDAAAIAALVRALVETASREWQENQAPVPTPTELLRLASWKASKAGVGVGGSLLHPLENRPCTADSGIQALLTHVGPVLDETGDLPLVQQATDRIRRTGTGADRQRESFARNASFRDVVLDAMGRTHSPV